MEVDKFYLQELSDIIDEGWRSFMFYVQNLGFDIDPNGQLIQVGQTIGDALRRGLTYAVDGAFSLVNYFSGGEAGIGGAGSYFFDNWHYGSKMRDQWVAHPDLYEDKNQCTYPGITRTIGGRTLDTCRYSGYQNRKLDGTLDSSIATNPHKISSGFEIHGSQDLN